MSAIFNTVLCVLQLAVLASCNEKALKPQDSVVVEKQRNDTVYYFNPDKKSVEQPFDVRIMQGNYKFVQVHVTKVVNPKKHPLTFEVYYKAANTEKLLLGTFSLYPPDNPGRFIVATQGKLKESGSVILSLVLPEEIGSNDTVAVTTSEIKLIEE